jgi:hypothetical protein
MDGDIDPYRLPEYLTAPLESYVSLHTALQLRGLIERLFTSLPALELPARFRRAELKRWLARIPSERSRTITQRKLDAFLASAAR